MRTIYQLQRDLMGDMGITSEDIPDKKADWAKVGQEDYERDTKGEIAAKGIQIQELDKLHTAIQNNIEQIDKHKSDGMTALMMISMVKLQIKDLADIARKAIEK